MVGLPNRAGRCTICKRMKLKVAIPFLERSIGGFLTSLESVILLVRRAQDADD